MVLRGSPDHCGPADINVLDGGIVVRASRDCGFKGVEVHDQQIDGPDPVLLHRRHMSGIVAHGEKATVDRRVQGLDPAIHHLGKAGDIGYVHDGKSGIAQHPG